MLTPRRADGIFVVGALGIPVRRDGAGRVGMCGRFCVHRGPSCVRRGGASSGLCGGEAPTPSAHSVATIKAKGKNQKAKGKGRIRIWTFCLWVWLFSTAKIDGKVREVDGGGGAKEDTPWFVR
jgi:hypothetical protein